MKDIMKNVEKAVEALEKFINPVKWVFIVLMVLILNEFNIVYDIMGLFSNGFSIATVSNIVGALAIGSGLAYCIDYYVNNEIKIFKN